MNLARKNMDSAVGRARNELGKMYRAISDPPSEYSQEDLDAWNPYNYLNPVRDESRLAGRSEEMTELEQMLRQTRVPQPQWQNTAIIGKRGSGKTSLLFAVEALASRLKLLPVYFALNNDTVSSSANFFSDLFETMIAAGEGVLGVRTASKLRGTLEKLNIRARVGVPVAEIEIQRPGESERRFGQSDLLGARPITGWQRQGFRGAIAPPLTALLRRSFRWSADIVPT